MKPLSTLQTSVFGLLAAVAVCFGPTSARAGTPAAPPADPSAQAAQAKEQAKEPQSPARVAAPPVVPATYKGQTGHRRPHKAKGTGPSPVAAKVQPGSPKTKATAAGQPGKPHHSKAHGGHGGSGHLPARGAAPPSTANLSTFDPSWESAPSTRYAQLSSAECLAELGRRAIPFDRVAEAPGVVTPVRVLDGVGGVLYRTAQSRAVRAKSPFDVADCRLVLALDDLSAILRKHDIDEAVMFSAWRPLRGAPTTGRLPSRHPGGLAIDIYQFGKWVAPESAAAPVPATAAEASGSADATGPATPSSPVAAPAQAAAGSPAAAAPPAPPAEPQERAWLHVEKDFGGRIGAETCGPSAEPPNPPTKEALELRAIVCEIDRARIFTTILTPNYNRAHFNHVHLDLTPSVKWRLAR